MSSSHKFLGAGLGLSLAALMLLGLSACDTGSQQTEQSDVDPSVVAKVEDLPKIQYDFGRKVSDAEVAGWDIDIRPDGQGLPPGEGSVEDGEELYEEKCASCHGLFGEGEGRWPKLAGGMDTLTHERPEKTVGSYWPYASTLWDYIRRAMPFTAPQSLSDDETYAITAYVLNLNDLVDEDFVLTRDNFTSIEMPNRDGFFIDNRPDVSSSRCMTNCKDPDSITIVESLLAAAPKSDSKENSETSHADDSVPSTEESEPVMSAGKSVYDSACKVCHSSGLAGAPIPGDTAAWETRMKQGIAVLYSHALEGYQGEEGVMPAKGGQVHLEDEAVTEAVDYMVEQSR